MPTSSSGRVIVMEVLTTRTLRYADADGKERDLVLTIFVPFEEEPGSWKCNLAFDPPVVRQPPAGDGVDFVQAFVSCLHHARVCLDASNLRVTWDGRADCGLPRYEGRRPIPQMDVLATRVLSCPDDKGGEREMLLTIFVPFRESDELWKCGFMFGPPAPTPVNYGFGKDYTEALLDCLAIAREAYETLVPEERAISGDLLDCADFPLGEERSFRLTRREEPPGTRT